MPKAWLDERDLIIERWAIRVATITSVTIEGAMPYVRQFHAAGGTEEMFTKMEQLVCEKGYEFTFLLQAIADSIPRPVFKVPYPEPITAEMIDGRRNGKLTK